MKPELIALHKHWCTADAVKQFISADIPANGNEEYPEWFISLGNAASKFHRLSVWYSLIYVVVEGFRELKLTHPEVDSLLNNEEYVECLRLFRNATFHYQKDPLTEKALKFLEAKDSEKWIKNLSKALESFFLEVLPINDHIKAIKHFAQNPLNEN
jgi:hypothetical protein